MLIKYTRNRYLLCSHLNRSSSTLLLLVAFLIIRQLRRTYCEHVKSKFKKPRPIVLRLLKFTEFVLYPCYSVFHILHTSSIYFLLCYLDITEILFNFKCIIKRYICLTLKLERIVVLDCRYYFSSI